MKQTSTKICFYPADKLKNQYEHPKNTIKGSHYSVCQVRVPSMNGAEWFIIQFSSKGEHEGLAIDEIIAKADRIRHHHLFSLEYYSHELVLDDKLKRNWDVWFLFEPFKFTLDEYIHRRRENSSKLADESLISFFKNMISLFAYLEHFNLSHKPIHPKNFMIMMDNSIKFDALDLAPHNYFHLEGLKTPHDYKAPEEFSGARFDARKARVFELGLIFLFATTTQDIHGLNTNENLLKERLAEFRADTPKFVVEILKKMLTFNIFERPNFEDLYKFVKKNETSFKESFSSPTTQKDSHYTFHEASPSKEERKTNSSQVHSPPILSPPKDHPKEAHAKDTETDDHKHKSSKTPTSAHKQKTVETIQDTTKLNIRYEKKKPKLKLLHQFMAGTKALLMIPLIKVKHFIVEVVDLDIPFMIPASHASVYAENDKIYLIGGQEEPEQTSNCYCYTDGQESLEQIPSFREASRINPGVCNVGKKIYVMGGATNTMKASLNSCEVLNIETNMWQDIAHMNSNCAEALFCSFNEEYIYRIGGIDDHGQVVKTIEKYWIKQNKWVELSLTETSKFMIPIKIPFGQQINQSEIFVFGGLNAEDKISTQTFVLDCSEAGWNRERLKLANVHSPEWFFVGAAKQNQAIVMEEELVFLSMDVELSRVCAFDSHAWKELKKLD